METNYKEYYAANLEEGKEYQDFVSDELQKFGLLFSPYTSKKYQFQKGENKLGMEIKKDKKFSATGNLYIEVAEKSHPSRQSYTPSGTERNDNTWLYLIGDDKIAYIFCKKILRAIIKTCRQVQTQTSIGHLLPIEKAEKYCSLKIRF